MNHVIGDTPLLYKIAQSRRGDFKWTLPFVDVAEDGTESETDLTDCVFQFVILELDGTTVKESLSIGDGITVNDNIVTIDMINSLFNDWLKGCEFPYYLTYENADGFTKCLFDSTFQLV